MGAPGKAAAMYDTQSQARIAKSASDAMLGYMQASNAASAAMMNNVFDFWTKAAKAMSGGSQGSARPMMAQWPVPQPNPAQLMMQPFEMWMSMTPFGRSPVVVQMAYAMMFFGVPRDVAMPTAEANAAAFDAVETAAAPFQDAFSNYRSDGGHASAQIKYVQHMMAALTLSPLGTAAGMPWMQATRGPGF